MHYQELWKYTIVTEVCLKGLFWWSSRLSTTIQVFSSIRSCRLSKVHAIFQPFGVDKLSTNLSWELNTQVSVLESPLKMGHMWLSISEPIVLFPRLWALRCSTAYVPSKVDSLIRDPPCLIYFNTFPEQGIILFALLVHKNNTNVLCIGTECKIMHY